MNLFKFRVLRKRDIVMRKRLFCILCVLFAMVLSTAFSSNLYRGNVVLKKPLNSKTLEMMPVTKDFRNYFILQSIDDVTNIIIGDFVGAEKVIALISDENSDGKVDKVFEYYPDKPKPNKRRPFKPTSALYEGFEKTKEMIINGEIFEKNYSYKMGSLKHVKYRLRKGTDIYKYRFGWVVRIFDPDSPGKIMYQFFFGRKDGRYYLQFETTYYKLYHTVIKPPVSLSVYCENSKDETVKEIVDELLEMVVKAR